MAIYECVEAASLLISNLDTKAQPFLVNGIQLFIRPNDTLIVPCVGSVDVTDVMSLGYIAVQVLSSPFLNWGAPLSFLAGLMVATAFVTASMKKW